jgi:hypothetical protein
VTGGSAGAPTATAPAVPAGPAQRVPGGMVGRRELLMFAVVAVAAGILIVAVLLGRRSSAEVAAAAPSEAIAPIPPSSVRAQPAPVTPMAWSSERQAQWIGNRRHAAAFELPANNTVSIWMGRVRPVLVVRCVEKKTEVFVFTGSAIKIEPNTEDHTVTYGFDDGVALNERWPDSAEHDALFAPDGFAFAARLLQARTMKFGFTPHNAEPVVAQFRVSGLGPLIDPVARECGSTP